MTSAIMNILLVLCAVCTCNSFVVSPMPARAATSRSTPRSTSVIMSATPYKSRPIEENSERPSRIQVIKTEDDFLAAMARGAERPVVIKFFDVACRACKAVAPKFERMAEQNPGVNFYKIELSQSKKLCRSLNIKILPTVHIYQGAKGKVLDVPVGPKRFHVAEEKLAELLSENGAAITIPE